MLFAAHRRIASASLGLVLASAAPAATAAKDEAKVRCAAAYEQAQVLRRQDKLSAAKSQLVICAETCPRALAADCVRWRAEVEELQPTLRLRATDGEGRPVDARVLVDGAVLLDHLVDTPVSVDTGDHVFHFESASGATDDVRASLHGGERGREIVAVLAPPAPLLTTDVGESRRPVPLPSYVLGAIGIAALGAAAVLSIKGHLDAADLRSRCAPSCNPSDVDSVGTLYDLAWVTGGVGVAAVAAALVFWRPWERAHPTHATGAFVAPSGGGAVVGFRFE